MKNSRVILDNWQKEVLKYEGNLVLCTGRQVGKTFIMSRKASKYALTHKNSQIIIVSLTEDQAKLMIMMILNYLIEFYSDKVVTNGRDKPTSKRITFNNGSHIIARPVGNTGDAVRGFTGDVLIIDEASRMSETVFTAVKPILLTTGGKIWMCSTPFGKQGYFYECWLNKHKRFKVWHITSEEAIKNREINNSWTAKKQKEAFKMLNEEKKDMTELHYAQEYLGEFIDDLRRFFDDELIEKTCYLKRQDVSPKDNNYLGVDIARMGDDDSSFEVLHVKDRGDNNINITQIENITTSKKMTTETERRIKEIANWFGCVKVGIDAGSGSLGVGIYDHLLEDPLMGRKVVAMNNRQISMDRHGKSYQRIFKEDLYDNLKAMMERDEIALLNDDDLMSSLRSIQFEFIKEMDKISKIRIFGRNSHIVEGLMRAAWLAKNERNKKFKIHYI